MPGKPSYKTAYIFIFHLNRHQILHETTKTYRTSDNLFIFLSGFFLQTINFLEVKTDAVSSATKSDYESGGYDHFLQKFQLPPAANNYEILSLHEKEAVYTVW